MAKETSRKAAVHMADDERPGSGYADDREPFEGCDLTRLDYDAEMRRAMKELVEILTRAARSVGTVDYHKVEDMIGHVLLKLVVHAAILREAKMTGRQFASWLFTVGQNETRDMHRKKGRLERMLDGLRGIGLPLGEDPREVVARGELRAWLSRVEQFASEDLKRYVLMLKAGIPKAEVVRVMAREQKISERTARRRLDAELERLGGIYRRRFGIEGQS